MRLKDLLVYFVLKLVNPQKPYGPFLYESLARVTVSVAIDTVVLRKNTKGNLEVLMSKRKENESYAKMWHCPGTILRPGETDKDAFKRLEQNEFGALLTKRQYICRCNNIFEERGHTYVLAFYCECLDPKLENLEWFPVDNLPKNTVDFQRDVTIPSAVRFYKAKKVSKSKT